MIYKYSVGVTLGVKKLFLYCYSLSSKPFILLTLFLSQNNGTFKKLIYNSPTSFPIYPLYLFNLLKSQNKD